MKDTTKELILNMLQEEYNTLHAHRLHLQHQMELPPEWRMNEMDHDEMDESLKQLNLRAFEIADAIDDIKGS